VRTAEDWAALRRSGASARRNGLRLRALRHDSETSPSRFGVAVKAAGRGRAVTRNLTKRRLRGAFAKVGPARGWDVGVWADPAATRLSYQELEDHLVAALKEVVR
jgi:ribonuclease P protein component